MLSGRRDYRGYICHPGSWTPLAQTHHHARVQTPQLWWYGTDITGAPAELTDAAGKTVWRAQRLAWGSLADEAWLAEGADNCLRLPGQYEDRETGLFYNLHRYYDPRHGRYITPDPIGLAGGLNAYAYVDGNPVSYTDPLGLKGMPGSETYPGGDRFPEPEINEPENRIYIPRDSSNNPFPLDKQRVEGQDIPLPHPDAEGRAHTTLGGKISTKNGEVYRQSAEFPADTWPLADGKAVPLSEVHWGDHGTPHHHPYNPHQHPFIFDGRIWLRAKSNQMLPFNSKSR